MPETCLVTIWFKPLPECSNIASKNWNSRFIGNARKIQRFSHNNTNQRRWWNLKLRLSQTFKNFIKYVYRNETDKINLFCFTNNNLLLNTILPYSGLQVITLLLWRNLGTKNYRISHLVILNRGQIKYKDFTMDQKKSFLGFSRTIYTSVYLGLVGKNIQSFYKIGRVLMVF